MIDPRVAVERLDEALAAGSFRERHMPRMAPVWKYVSWVASYAVLVGGVLLMHGQLVGLAVVASIFGAAFVAGYPLRRRNRRHAAAGRRVREAVRDHPGDVVEIAYHTRGEYGPKGYGLLVLMWIVLRDGTEAPVRLTPDELKKVLAQLAERCPEATVHTGDPLNRSGSRARLAGGAGARWLPPRRHEVLAAPGSSTPGASNGPIEDAEET